MVIFTFTIYILKLNKTYLLTAFFVLWCCVAAKAQFYTGSNQEFGKNRVQHNTFFWQSFNFEEFQVFFYTGGKNHAIYAAKSAHKSIAEMEAMLDYDLTEKLEILVFNRQSDFHQSNVGLRNDGTSNIGGATQIVGSKLFVYYEGDHAKLDAQIKSGIAEIMLRKIMYGGNWKEVIKNNTLLSVPDWFTKGFVSYVAEPWSVEIDNQVKDAFSSGKFENFNALSGEDAELAGHTVWNYIVEVYGENVVPNVLYMTRVSRSVENGFLFVLGTSLRNLMYDYNQYYQKKYELDDKFRMPVSGEQLAFKKKSKYAYAQFKMSPNGKFAAFTTNERGQHKVWVYNIAEQKLEKINKGGVKLERKPDRTYPVLCWHPSSRALTYFLEHKGEVTINIYSTDSKKTTRKPVPKLNKVLDATYSDDGKLIALSAAQEGQTDLYLYKVAGNFPQQLTNDFYDDIHPSFIDHSTRIIFSSNRPGDTLPKPGKTPIERYGSNFDLFIYDIKRPTFLTRITNTPEIHETAPAQYDSSRYAYLADDKGIVNRYLAYYDSAISHIDTTVHYRYFSQISPVTNYSRNILEHDFNWKKGRYTQLILKDGEYLFLQGNVKHDQLLTSEQIYPTQYYKTTKAGTAMNTIILGSENTTSDSTDNQKIDINNYTFEGENPTYEKEVVTFEDPPKETNKPKDKKGPKKEEEPEFELPRQDIYQINFTADNVTLQLNSSFLNPSYQRFAPGLFYANPGFNNMTQVGMIDLMEDYRIIAGFRLPASLNSSEYLLSFENLKHRLDKRYLVSRQAFTRFYEQRIEKVQTYNAKYNVKWPFSEVSSVRATADVRIDQITAKSTNQRTLEIPGQADLMGGIKLEYVFDNTVPLGLNLNEGLRLKVWGEAYREISSETDFFNLGADVRHYTHVWRKIIWANRIAGSTSFGNRKLVNYLGGVDNWLRPRFDTNIDVDTDKGYFFQTIATPMRGFIQNTRNGNSFVVINSEFRVPILKIFSPTPLKSDFAENLMLVGFGDVGAAWTGWDPYSEDNSFNTSTIRDANVLVTLQNQREPIIWGYGLGLRTRLLGYYVRFDWAWGVDDGVVQPAVRYLSLSMDF